MKAFAERIRRPEKFALPPAEMFSRLGVLVLAGMLSVSAGGCMTFEAFRLAVASPPPDLTIIKVGATRETVERVLGQPVRRESNVHTYEYDRRHVGPLVGGAALLIFGAMDFFTAGLFSAAHWHDMKKAEEAQRASVSIVYGPRDTVIGVSHQQAEAQYLAWLHSRNRKQGLARLCLAANAGYAPAQSAQAMRYWYGLWDTDVDRVQAYLWLRLAAFGGERSASQIADEWPAVMTGDQVAEADRLFKEWEPAPCYGPDDRVLTFDPPPPPKTSGKGRAIPVSADQVELVDLSMHPEALPALLTGRLRNRSALLLTDVSIKVSFYDGQRKVGEATLGGFADRLQGKTSGEKGISDMRILPGEAREFAVRFEKRGPAHYTRIEHHVFDAWGTPPPEPEALTGPDPAQP